jgi:hypothetical protein
MNLFIGIFIGILYGRNVQDINRRAIEDVQKIATLLSKTQFATTTYYMIEGIYMAIERKFVHKNVHTHDILCTCNRRTCKPVSINTYVKKLKAIN